MRRHCHPSQSLIRCDIRKLYAAANAIFSHTKYVSDVVKLSLIDAYVLPIMTYALEAVSLTRGQYDEFSVCWNNLFRRVFNMHKWESVKLIQYYVAVWTSLGFVTFAGYAFCIKCQFVRMWR